MKYAQLVIGPAGCGKSTYCHLIQQHCYNSRRTCKVINLDPAAENFNYDCHADVRDLVTVEDMMKEMEFGPNGGLLAAMEYLSDNIEWLESQFDDFAEDEYVLIDCPGQIELYSHLPVMRSIVQSIVSWDVRLCAVYCIDTSFISDASKFITGALSSLSAMIQLELPHINVLTKADLVKDDQTISDVLESEPSDIAAKLNTISPQLKRLHGAVALLLEDYSLVSFVPLNPDDEDSIAEVLAAVNQSIQYGEDLETRDDYDMGGANEMS